MNYRGPRPEARVLSCNQVAWAYSQWRDGRYTWAEIARALGVYYQLLLQAVDREGYDRDPEVRKPLVVPDHLKLGVG